MCTRTQDRQGTPARSASRSLAKAPATCVQDVRIGYIQDGGLRNSADYSKYNGWIFTTRMTSPHARSPQPSPAYTPTMSDKMFNVLQWNVNGIGNKQTERSIFLEVHDVKVVVIQESKLTATSRSPNIQNYTLVRQDQRQGQEEAYCFLFITQSASIASHSQQRRSMTPT